MSANNGATNSSVHQLIMVNKTFSQFSHGLSVLLTGLSASLSVLLTQHVYIGSHNRVKKQIRPQQDLKNKNKNI